MEFVHKHIEMDSFENFVCIFIRKHPILSFNKNISAIAALKGQFVGHCYHSIVFSKGPQTFFGNFLG